MVDRQDGTPSALSTAETKFAAASTELRRQAVAAELRERRGLHYASIGDDRTGPHLVVYNGEVVGELHTTSPGILKDWYAVPIGSTTEVGPFVTARAAAAGLITEERSV
jgi:hypothetical protein